MPSSPRLASLSDIPAIIDAFFDAFHDHPLTLRAFIPRTEQVDAYWSQALNAEVQDPNAHYLIITDGPERVLAFGKWRQPLTSTSPPIPPLPSWPEGADVAFVEEVFGAIEKKHKEIMGDRPHWYLEILGVRKEFQGKGLGKQLLQWGLSRADDAGAEAFLAASPAGAPMYKKYGFDLLETMEIDDGRRIESFMLRPAKKIQA
ncbi:acyl-CoA N-acyltransferase [Hypoxylon crocopeplum]|nr:acyl-CoA N-acyltransferase [Hypoxylon crocopeplum]